MDMRYHEKWNTEKTTIELEKLTGVTLSTQET